MRRNAIELQRFKLKYLLSFVIYFVLLYRFLCDFLHFPSFSRYIIDFCLIVLLLFTILRKKCKNKYYIKLLKYTLIYYLIMFVSYFVSFQSLFYIFYGSLSIFRYYIFALLCICWLNDKDVKRIISFINKLFYLNASFVFFQYFVLGLYGDYLGGIFGIVQGCNAYLNVFLCFTISYAVFDYLQSNASLKSLILKLLTALVIGAIAELKFFFLEVLIIFAFALLFSGFTWKKLTITITGILGMMVGFAVFSKMYSYADSFLKLDSWIQISTSGSYSAGYGGVGEINRLTFMNVIDNQFNRSFFQNAFGFGLGNCGFSNISLFNTPFFNQYEYIRYQWFTSSYVYLEQGLVGMILYLTYFIYIIVLSQKRKKDKDANVVYCYLCQIMGIISFMLFLYNSSLTLECGFLVYFSLVLPFIKKI